MKNVRRVVVLLVASLATLIGFVTAANAMPLPLPPAGPDAPAANTAVAQGGGGIEIWQLALIAAASAAVLVIVTMFATLAATKSRRPAITGS
jgi:hypothetical protein